MSRLVTLPDLQQLEDVVGATVVEIGHRDADVSGDLNGLCIRYLKDGEVREIEFCYGDLGEWIAYSGKPRE
jgi:hypothetical protein